MKEHEVLTSYIIPAGTNSGALAERVDELTGGSSWGGGHLLEADVLFAWATFGLFRSENQRETLTKSIEKKPHDRTDTTVIDACVFVADVW